MKRSELNQIIKDATEFLEYHGFHLPAFANFSPSELRKHRDSDIFRNGLGWDVTDYCEGKFDELGLFLFTIRNGRPENLKAGKGVVYAEKIMISRNRQISPMHRHIEKTEDIINRGGARLVLELYASDKDGKPDRESPFSVPMDGLNRELSAGSRIALMPGESVTLHPGIWHAFWGEGGDVLIGEVSTVNDDLNDNVFERSLKRFTAVDEDEDPFRLLVSDYNSPWIAK